MTQAVKDYDRRRGTACQRGYGRRWQKVRSIQLARRPLCAECDRAGHIVPATEVHHIRDRKQCPALAYDLDNLESLCKSCHSKATGAGRG